MLQCQSKSELDNLSWKQVGKTIVNTIGQILNIDVAILHSERPSSITDRYFIHQQSRSQVNQIDEDLLKQTIKSLEELSTIEDLTIDLYQPQPLTENYPRARACLQANIGSSISIPVFCQENLVASLTIHRFLPNCSWQSEEIKLAQMIAKHATLAISQVLAYEQVQALCQREQTLNRITATIRSSLEPKVMFAAIARELGEALQVDGCTLSLWTKHDKFVKCVGLYNPHETTDLPDRQDWQQATTSAVPIAENPILQALLYTKKPVKSDDLERQKKLARYELPWHSKARALLIVPLIVEEQIIGSITLRQSDSSRSWNDSDVELAEAVASPAAIAVQQARLYEITRKQAEQLQIKEREVRKLNNYLTESVLKRFLPEAIVNKAARGELLLDLKPEPRRITILFCDLVDSTKLSGQLGSRLLAKILNEYLEAMSKAVFDRGGTVDKFIGDGIMAMFGAPEELSRREQARRAIATAQTMHSYLQQLNQKWQTKGLLINKKIPTLQMRCGIHQGRAIVGMFGGGQRKDYTAIGQVVNIAARLQGVAAPNNILISKTVANCLENLKIEQVQSYKLKGIKEDFSTLAIAIE